jgi:glucose-1-phosphate adenylyltransferase
MVRGGSTLDGVVMLGADWYEHDQEHKENERLHRPHLGIGHDCHIQRAIIDKNARIGSRVRILSHEGRPDSEDSQGRWYVRDGIVVIPKNAVIDEGVVIAPA